MLGKSKEPKAVRHEVAKEKCKIYQRSVSSKFRNPQNKDVVPVPGQFALRSPELQLTTNLKTIMKEEHPESASNFLSLNASRRNSLHKTSSHLKLSTEYNLKPMDRVESHKAIRKAAVNADKLQPVELKEAQKKNSYLVKSRLQIPKYSQGYRIVKLDYPQQSKLRLKTAAEQLQKEEENAPNDKEINTQFLPVEYYLLQSETPNELMHKYRVGQSDYVLGYSRWYDLNGKSTWRKCRVLNYIEGSGRWAIQWLHNGRQKEISRINLFFEGESRTYFEKRVASAELYRKLSEVYLKYNIQIDEMTTQTHQLSEKDLEKIIVRIGKVQFNQKIENLQEEIVELYVRANHQAQFNASLPFNRKRREEFQPFLPPFYFQPNQQYKIRYNISKASDIKQSSKKYFLAAANSFKEKTSFGSKSRLLILEYLNNLEQENKNSTLISWKEEKIYNLDDFLKGAQNHIQEFLRKITCAICDIEHHIGNELDQQYLKKKANCQIFEAATKTYSKFLSMIVIRMENVIRKVFISSIDKLSSAFSMKSAENQGKSRLKLEIVLAIKQGRVQGDPSSYLIKEKIADFLERLNNRLESIPCPSKSYLDSLRKGNTMKVIYEKMDLNLNKEKMNASVEQCLKNLKKELFATCGHLEKFMLSLNQCAQQILSLTSEIRKQIQKKCSYAELSDLTDRINALEHQLTTLAKKYSDPEDKNWSINVFSLRVEEAMSKLRKKHYEGRRELYRNVLERILRENEKLQKQIDGLGQRLQCNPANILQMLSLQKLVREEAGQEMDKIYIKLKEIPSKLQILQTIDQLDYRDYEACNRIFIIPLRLRQKLTSVKRDLEGTYRKRFGEELNRDAGRVLQMTRQCGQELMECLKIQNLQEMCEKFMQFSNLHERIEKGLKEADLINDRQSAMSWSKTDFSKLKNISHDFNPYYTLITLAKNYQLHLQLLADGPFQEIEHQKLQNQLEDAKKQLLKVRQLFGKNPRMSRVTIQVDQKYKDFGDNLPLIKALRNTDLRQRHWATIKQVISINPLDETVSLKNLLASGVKSHINQLEEISSIASRELVYEKRLIRLKREWKEIKMQLGADGDALKIITNLKWLRQRVQTDIFQVQDMLSATFIKFLESQILCWRNQILYRAYELLQRWEKVQTDVLLVAAIFGKPKAKQDLPGQYIRFQILQKAWRSLCNQVEPQPWLADVLQGRAFDSLGALSSSIQRVKKHLYAFFQEKKRQYARLACLSDDQFVCLLSCDETDPSENAVFEQTVRKCFQNIRTLVRDERHQIIKIKTRSDEEIPLTQINYVEKIIEYVLPNEIIMDLQRRIQRELKTSLQRIIKYPHNHTAQVLLLYQRLNFTLRLQEQIITNHCISAAFLRELQFYRDQLVATLTDSAPTPKNQCQLLQALYHLQITSSLWHYPAVEIYSFHWLSQPRTYMRGQQYLVEVGLLTQPYGFEIVDLDNLITEQWSARVYCSYAGAIRERGFCLVGASSTVGKTASIKKLAALFGHKQYILDCNPLVSSRNLLEYLRMAAAGIWVILRNIQKLTQPQMSLMARNLEVCWVNHLTRPKQGFTVDGTGIMFKSTYLKAFATVDYNHFSRNDVFSETNNLKSYFRIIYLPKINIEFIIEVKLLILGLQHINFKRLSCIIEYLKRTLSLNSQYCRTYSEIYLIKKLFDRIQQLRKEQYITQWKEEVFDVTIVEMIQQITKQEDLKEKILQNLHQNFRVASEKIERKNIESAKEHFIGLKYHYTLSLLQAYTRLVDSVDSHTMIILIGPHDAGKSALINMLWKHHDIQLKFICPNAYEMNQLYGDDLSNGVISCLIEQILKQLKINKGKKKGLVYDGELGLWIQPLSTIISSGHIIQPNGNTLLIQQEIKFIFECRSISNASPNLLLHSAIIILQQPLKWQNIFTWYLNTQFQKRYCQQAFIKFVQPFIPYIVDPLIEFYESTCVEFKTSRNHCYISPNSLIHSLLRLYECLLDYHFLDKKLESLNEKDCSDSFNIFVIALVWTIGVILPEQARRSFSRHFKYLIKRAVQVNIQGVNKQTLPEDDHNLYKIYYSKDRWQQWNQSFLHPFTFTPKNQNLFIGRPEDMGLTFIMERYLEKAHSVFMVGFSSTQKSTFFEGIIQGLSSQVYNIRKVVFGPNSQAHHLKKEILQEMAKQKYSYGFNGFVHGKKTLISVRDLNMPMVKNEQNNPVSAHEFIRHYFITGGWFMKDSAQHHSFKNILFCGTLNIRQTLPTYLLKNINLVFRPSQKEDIAIVISNIFAKSLLCDLKNTLVSLICNLHVAITRQMSCLAFANLEGNDAINIARSLSKMGSAEKIEIFKRWIFLSEKIYQQKLQTDQSERLFYLINNVLMEEQKIRYKSIKPNPSIYFTYYPSPEFLYHNLSTLKNKIEQICKEAIQLDEFQGEKGEKVRRRETKLNQFACSELNLNLDSYNQHIILTNNRKELDLKPNHVKLIAHLVNTFEVQTPFILAFSLSEDPTKSHSLDLQECLEIAAVARGAKLVDIKLDQLSWKASKESWRNIILGVIEEILSSMEKQQPLNQVIIYLDDFKSEHDYIIDDFIAMKRLNVLPFSIEVQSMLEFYLENIGKLKMLAKKANAEGQQGEGEYYDMQSKSKGRQRKYELQRKQKEKSLKALHQTILSKIKAVINVRETSLIQAKENKICKWYSDFLREFAILNMSFFIQDESVAANKKWNVDMQPSLVSIKSNTIITEIINKEEAEEKEEDYHSHVESSVVQIFLKEDQEDILDSISQKMINRYCLEEDQKWLRGKNNDLKKLYFEIKERLNKLCCEKMELLTKRRKKIEVLQTFREELQQKKKEENELQRKMEEQYIVMKKQKQEREMDYEKCLTNTQNTQIHLSQLQREKQELQIQYERMIDKTKKELDTEKQSLIQCIKNGKDKKIIALNNEFKILFQGLGIIVDKKIKKQEQMYKQVIKDINNPIVNGKIVKKLTHLLPTIFFNMPERVVMKVKELMKETEGEKWQRRGKVEEKEKDERKDESYLDKLIKTLRMFIVKLIQFHGKTQQKDIKQCLRRLSQNQRNEEKVRDLQSKTLKSNEYKAIFSRYEQIRQSVALLQQNISEIKKKKSISDYTFKKIQTLFSIKYPFGEFCSSDHPDFYNCNFFCWVKAQLRSQQDKVQQIEQSIKSFAFTITLTFYYKLEDKDKELHEIMSEIRRSKSKNVDMSCISFLEEELKKLIHINKLIKHIGNGQIKGDNLTEELKESSQIHMQLQREIDSQSILSLIQFVPGIVVLGLQRGSLNLKSRETSSKESSGLIADRIRTLYGQYLISTNDVIGWIRNRNNISNHKICFSSRVTLQNRYFPKSMRSIVREDNEQSKSTQKICLLWISSKDEFRTLLKTMRRQQVSNDLTVIIVTQSDNVALEEKALCLRLGGQNLNELQKKIESIISVENQKNQSYIEQVINQHNEEKQILTLGIDYVMDTFNFQTIDKIKNALMGEVDQNKLNELIEFTNNERLIAEMKRRSSGQMKNVASSIKLPEKLSLDDSKHQLRTLKEWTAIANERFNKGQQILSEDENVIRLSSQRTKFNQNHQKIIKYLLRIYEMIMYFQQRQRLPRHLSTLKFVSILRDIFDNESKQNIKKTLKLLNQLKIISWNHIACLYKQQELLMLLIFIFANEQQNSDYSDLELCQILELCLQNYEEGLILFSINSVNLHEKRQSIKYYFKHIEETVNEQKSEDSDENLEIDLSDLLRRKLKNLQNRIKKKGISESFEENIRKWYEFLNQINQETMAIPDQLFTTSKLLLFYLLTLISPSKALLWLKKNDKDGYIFKQEMIPQQISGLKLPSTSLSDVSYYSEWSQLSERLHYMYNHLKSKQSLLVNTSIQSIIQMCLYSRISFVHFDVSTALWRIDRSHKKKINTDNQQQIQQNDEDAELREEQKILDEIKNSIKSQSWIIINLNNHKLLDMDISTYFKRISSLIDKVLSPEIHNTPSSIIENMNESTNLKRKLQRSNSHNSVNINLYKYMIVYLMDFSNKKSLDEIQEQDNKDKLEIINNYVMSNKCYINIKNQNQRDSHQELSLIMSDYRSYYYLSVNKYKKKKKIYERLSFSQKKIIFEFVQICHKMLLELATSLQQEEDVIEINFFEEILSRVSGCINILKGGQHFKLTQEEENLLRYCKIKNNEPKYENQSYAKVSSILMKVEQYLILMVEYTFELNYKVSLSRRRIFSTHEFVATVRAELPYMNNYELEHIVSQLNLQDNKLYHLPTELINQEDIDIELIYVNFQPEGFSLELCETKKDTGIREQEEKLITIFQHENKLDYQSKVKEIYLLYRQQIDHIKYIIEMLKLFDLKVVHDRYRDLSLQIQTTIGNYEKKFSGTTRINSRNLASSRSVKISTVVTNALTQIFNRETSGKNKSDSNFEMFEFEEFLLSSLILLKKKTSSLYLFLQDLRQIIKDYVDMEYSSTVKLQNLDISDESSDQEENTKKMQEQELKLLIKKRVQIKFSVDRLMRKLISIYGKITPQNNHKKKDLTFKEIIRIFKAIEIVKKKLPQIDEAISEGLVNYKAFETQSKQAISFNSDGSQYFYFRPQQFLFRFNIHRLAELILIMKIIHCKKFNQEIYQLNYSLRLCSQKRKKLNETLFYFKGFKLVNGCWDNRSEKSDLDVLVGNQEQQKNMMVEVRVFEDLDNCSQDSIEDDLQAGKIWFRCPLYINDSQQMISTRERVKIQIRELYEGLILKGNIYMIGQ